MKYKISTYVNNKKISEGTADIDIYEFQRIRGKVEFGCFTIKYKALNTKENEKEIEAFLRKYPTPKSFYQL